MILLCLLMGVLQVVYGANNSTYYVRPERDSNCNGHFPCNTLSYYANNMLKSNSTSPELANSTEVFLIFLSGEHNLDKELNFSEWNNKIKFVMNGYEENENSANITLSASVYLRVSKVEIHWITFRDIPISADFDASYFEIVLLQNVIITNCNGNFFFDGSYSSNAVVEFNNIQMSNNRDLFLWFYMVELNFTGNNITSNSISGTLFDISRSSITLRDNIFTENTARRDGSLCLISVTTTQMILISYNRFDQNKGRLITARSSNILFNGSSIISFNEASYNYGPVVLESSNISFSGNTYFVANSASDYGGAMVMSSHSSFNICDKAYILFENNTAGNRGGAIYIYNDECENQVDFFHFFGDNFSLIFENNHAHIAGDDIYGGNASILLTKNVIMNNTVSSDPTQICPCNEGGIICCPYDNPHGIEKCSNMTEKIFPGQNLTFQVQAIEQYGKATPTDIIIQDELFWINGNCTTISFHLQNYSVGKTVSKTVSPYYYYNYYEPYYNYECNVNNSLEIHVNISENCPKGFIFNENSCVCDDRLQQFKRISCDINTQKISHTGDIWVGYYSSTSINNSGLIIHSLPCPFDYCVNDPEPFELDTPDKQCDNHRSGLLCGQCSSGRSERFGGTSKCQECSNKNLAFLIPFFLAGIGLLVFLFVLRVTVNYGTLSGLIFFANIIQVNRSVFNPNGQDTYTKLLTVFIAWFNLDLGIETCFYNGMDAYGRTWLQFVFPFYIVGLCGLIIFLSSRSRRISKLLGSNPVAVLATLILFSYLKVFRTILTVVLFTHLKYPGNITKDVWLLDGNIEMGSRKHVALFSFALLVFLVLLIQYTLLLLFDQWLQPFSHRKILSWAKNTKLKAFLDTYHGPYKARHRYWTGLLLLFRVVLAVVNAFAAAYDLSYSFKLFAIVSVVFLCLLWVGRVYRKWPLYILEGSFLVNLGLLSVAIYHVRAKDNYKEGDEVCYFKTSVSIALITFLGILAYHLYLIIHTTKVMESVKVKVNKMMSFKENAIQLKDFTTIPNNSQGSTSTTVELREPLLDDGDTHNE